MRTLCERDAAAVTDVVAQLAALDDALAFPPHFVEQLRVLMGADTLAYNDLDREQSRSLLMVWAEDGSEPQAGIPDDTEHEAEMYWTYRHELVLSRHRERTNDWTHAYKLTDFSTRRAFRSTNIWNLAYRDLGANYWLSVGLRSDGRRTRNFVLTSERHDFTARDCLVLDLLQPHLQQRWQRTGDAAAAVEELSAVDWDDPRHIVVCSRGGVIEFGTPAARRILAAFDASNGRVPPQLLAAPSVRVRDDVRMTVHPAKAGGLTFLLLAETDVRLDRLTPRQRTILEHAAEGASNRAIGEHLGISAATVRKHLEAIYERLGVHGRTEAAALLRKAGATPSAAN